MGHICPICLQINTQKHLTILLQKSQKIVFLYIFLYSGVPGILYNEQKRSTTNTGYFYHPVLLMCHNIVVSLLFFYYSISCMF